MEVITITKKEYLDLIKDQRLLLALEAVGVEEWEKYETALKINNSKSNLINNIFKSLYETN